MCLGIPARVVSVDGSRAVLDLRGREVIADATMVAVSPGDYVVSYAGLIVQVLTPDDAQETLRMLEAAERDGLVS
jgi:hydrogenase expression/formation protein HypC